MIINKNIIDNLDQDMSNFMLASMYLEKYQYSSAATYYLRCAEVTDNSILEYQSLLLAALCTSYMNNELDKTIQLIEDAIKIFPFTYCSKKCLELILDMQNNSDHKKNNSRLFNIIQYHISFLNINKVRQEIDDLYNLYDTNIGVWGWCSNEKAYKIIDCVIETCKNKISPICVEIGVYGGKSLFPFGCALKHLNKGKIYAIDPWLNSEAIIGYDGVNYDFWSSIPLETTIYDIFLKGLEDLKIQNFVEIIKTASDNAPRIENISVLHIDGQHTDQLIRDINKYGTCVIDNGYCFLDDVEWSEETKKSTSLIESLGFVKIDDIQGCFVYKKHQ